MSDIILFYTNFTNLEKAKAVGKTIIKENLAACVNIIPNITSIYQWEGEIQESNEVILIGKTQKSLINAVENKIISLHDYDLPCFLAFEPNYANSLFCDWVEKNTNLHRNC